ncbi:MAG: hypothetical protein H7328_11985, partial [Bdellovibrio sp.]|nr:hypothetical protein [Bdellovibrio sp.]
MSVFSVSAALAAPKLISFQTKIYKPDGTPLEATSVQFKFSLMNPLSTCVIYSETFSNVDLSSSGGSAVLALGDPVKAARSYPVLGTMKWYDAFNNNTPTYTCQTTGTFSPSLIDNRRLVMQFNDGSGNGWQTLPPMDINSVPFAMFAESSEKLGINTAADFILGTAIPSCTGSDVLTRIAGTFSCVTAAAATSMNPSGLLAGGAAPGQVLKFNGTNWVPSSDSTGAASGVTMVSSTNSYLSVAAGTSTPALTLNVGTGTNTVAAGNDARITGAFQAATSLSGDLTGTLLNPVIASGAVNNAKISDVAFNKITGKPTTLSGYAITMTSNDVTNALGYTPSNGTSALTSANIFVGNGSNFAEGRVLSGDATITNLGVLTVNNGVINNAKISDVAFSKISGKPTTLAGYTITMISSDITTALGYTPGSGGGTVGSVTSAATSGNPITVSTSSTSPSIDITRATASVNGYLASSDFTAFAAKLTSGLNSGRIFVGNSSNFAEAFVISGDATISNTGILSLSNSGVGAGTFSKLTVDLKGRVTAAGVLNSNDITNALGYTPGSGGGTVGSVTSAGTSGNPITVSTSSTSPSIDISRATASVNGYLAASDFTAFAAKLTSGLNSGRIFVGNSSNVAEAFVLSGD